MQTIGSKSCILIGYRLESGANSKYVCRELRLYKVRFGTESIILSLVSGGINHQTQEGIMPKAMQNIGEEMEEGPDLHVVINPEEVRSHVEALDEAMGMVEENNNENNTEGITEITIQKIKMVLGNTFSMMAEANIEAMFEAVKDHSFRVLQPRLDGTDQLLEEIIPMEEVPQAPDVIRNIETSDPSWKMTRYCWENHLMHLKWPMTNWPWPVVH